jgi:glutaredoxin 3
MKPVEIYTTGLCGYCFRAKRLLDRKGVPYTEYDVTFDPKKRAEMRERAGRDTVPQIFIDDRSIGGSDEIHALDEDGQLDDMLGL